MAHSTRECAHQQLQQQYAPPQQQQYYSHQQQWMAPTFNSQSSPSQRANYVHNFDPSTPPEARNPYQLQHTYQQQPYYPRARADSASSPHTPVFEGKISPPASTTRTPQLIKCSTCMSLVPLLELSEHICRPLPSQFEINSSVNARKANNVGAGLRINIVQAAEAQYKGIAPSNNHSVDSRGLSPIDQRTPSPRGSTPLTAQPGLIQYTPHGGSLAPLAAASGGYASSDINEPYAVPLQSAPLPSSSEDDTMKIQQGMPRSFSSKSALAKVAEQSSPTRGLASHLRANIDGLSPTSTSPNSVSGSGNSAKFFQRYDQIYGAGPPPTSTAMSFTHSLPAAQRHDDDATSMPDAQSQELRSTWSTQSSVASTRPIRAALPHQTSDELSRGQQAYNRFGRSDTYRERELQRHHRMQSAESSENSSDSPSSSSFSHDRLRRNNAANDASATMGFLESATPDTSPEMPDIPMFARTQDKGKVRADRATQQVQQLSRRQPRDQHSSNEATSIDVPQLSPTADATSFGISASFTERRREDRDSLAAVTDEFLDSYPTPQATFSGSFGALVINDTETPFDPPCAVQSVIGRSSVPSRKRSNAFLNSAAAEHADHDEDDTPRVPQEAAFLTATQKANAGGSGPGLEACLDDLMKEMNRDSYCEHNGAKSSQLQVRGMVQPGLGMAGQLRRKLTNPKSDPIDSASDSIAAARLQLAPSPILAAKAFDRPERTPSPLLSPAPLPTIDPVKRPYALSPNSVTPRNERKASDDPANKLSSASSVSCATCQKGIARGAPKQRKGNQTFCQTCYADLYLPKCQRCSVAIEGRAVGSSDGKLKGKYHPDCFTCLDCGARFPTGDFYVFGENPYCARHYHALNGTLCANSGCTLEGIEGPCVSLVGEENGNGGRYHPNCFVCSQPRCNILLDQWHYNFGGLPYCENHAREVEEIEQAAASYNQGSNAPEVYTPAEYNDREGYFPPFAQSSALKNSHQQYEASHTPRSISPLQHLPPNGTSISALRKNSTTPAYNAVRPRQNGPQHQQLTSYQQWHQHQQQQQQQQQQHHHSRPIFGQQTHVYPTPPSVGPGLNTLRRAERRRTVIQRI